MGNYYNNSVNWLEHHLLQCPMKKAFGIDCPGCGMQRSVIALLRLDVGASWKIYPPGIFIVCTVLFMMLHLCFDFKYGAAILKMLYIVSAIAIVINYAYKIINNQLF
jgi:hypothetical protein